MLEPCVCILRKLVYADPSLRNSLAQHNLLLITLLRGALFLKDTSLRTRVATVYMWGGFGYKNVMIYRCIAFNHVVTNCSHV